MSIRLPFLCLALQAMIGFGLIVMSPLRGQDSPATLEAYQALHDGDYSKAVHFYTLRIERTPDDEDAFFNRGIAHAALGHFAKAITDYTQALQLNPDHSAVYSYRAYVYEEKGLYAKAIADFNKAVSVGPFTQSGTVDDYNELAWLLATCPQAKFRDGKLAVVNAKAGWEASLERSANVTDTMAAAYAEAGDFSSAVMWEQKFLATPGLTKEEMAEAKKRLALYESGKPYREKE
jgi:tetratricopeptide (TPR) repeat protein